MGASFITFGYFLLGAGPAIAFFLVFIAPKSFLVLLSATSAFYWLLTLLLISAIFRGFLPLPQTAASYAGLIIGSVFIQELARCLSWYIHSRTSRVLASHADQFGHRFHLLDKLYLGLGWGWGHGAAHVIFFYLSFLPLTTGDGTWYLDTCPSISIFLAGAIYSLAFGMLLPSLMVIAWEGMHLRSWTTTACVPIIHLGASALTLLNFRRNGCQIVFPLLIVIGASCMGFASWLIWKKGIAQRAEMLASSSSSPATTSLSVTPLVHQDGHSSARDNGWTAHQEQFNSSTSQAATQAAAVPLSQQPLHARRRAASRAVDTLPAQQAHS